LEGKKKNVKELVTPTEVQKGDMSPKKSAQKTVQKGIIRTRFELPNYIL
jgi:hypothetical protein